MLQKKSAKIFTILLCVVLLFTLLSVQTAFAALKITLSSGKTAPSTIYVGKTYKLTVEGESVKFKSSDKSIATISSKNSIGTLHPVAPGTVKISAIKESTGKTCATITFTVKLRAESISANVTSLHLQPGATFQLETAITPANSTDCITFGSDNREVATVSGSGLITAVGAGTCNVKAYAKATSSTSASDSSTKVAYISITVSDANEPVFFSNDLPEKLDYFKCSGELKLTVHAISNDNTDVSYQWYQCDNTNKDNMTAIEGAVSSDFTPVSALQNQSYYYFCRASVNAETYKDSVVEQVTVQEHNYVSDVCTICGKVNSDDYAPNADGVYEISDASDLLKFAIVVNGGNTTANAELTQDIDMTGYEMTAMATFGGTIDGGSHTIFGTSQNLVSTLSSSGVIKDITFTNANIYTESDYAGIVADINYGLIEKCLVRNSEIQRSYKAAEVGGICGGNLTDAQTGKSGIVRNCGVLSSNLVKYGTATLNYPKNVGGIVSLNNGEVNSCYVALCDYGSGSPTGTIINSGNEPVNSYYCERADLSVTLNIINGTTVTEGQLHSGYMTYQLNHEVSDGSQVWRQNITSNSYPSFIGGTVYYTSMSCLADDKGYSNSNAAVGHSYNANGYCTKCGGEQAAVLRNGVYEIANAGQLCWFVKSVNSGTTSLNAKLTANIDLNGIDWTPMSSYSGTFNGNGKTISNLNSTSTADGFALSISSGGTVKNVTFDHSSMFPQRSGGCGAIAGKNRGTITNCIVKNSYIQYGAWSFFGGIAGANYGTISNCAVTDTTILRRYGGSDSKDGKPLGGICENNGGTVINCYTYSCNLKNGLLTRGGVVAYGNQCENCFFYTASEVGSTVDGTAVTEEQFHSGEVTYTLDNTRTDGNQVWYQTCGESVPAFSGKTVYSGFADCAAETVSYSNTPFAEEIDHSVDAWTDNGDGTHSGMCNICHEEQTEDHIDENADDICDVCGANLAPALISVAISWGAMEFTYTDASQGTWNPMTHTYENATNAEWTCDAGADKITVSSESNVDLTALFSYEKADGITVAGSFTDGTSPVTAALPLAKKTDTAQAVVVYLKLDGKPEKTADKTVMGTVTVTIGG